MILLPIAFGASWCFALHVFRTLRDGAFRAVLSENGRTVYVRTCSGCVCRAENVQREVSRERLPYLVFTPRIGVNTLLCCHVVSPAK